MVSMDELVKGRDKQFPNEFTDEIKSNLEDLLGVINEVRARYGKPMTVTSGWRPAAINAATPGAAKNSAHCLGLAVDISDTTGELWSWVLANLDLMQSLGIFLEDRRWTPTWVHFGLKKPLSGKRIFVPSTAAAGKPDAWDGKYDKKYDV